MGGRGVSSMSSSVARPGDAGYGVPSENGSMKKAIAYHGSSALFNEFDPSFADSRHQNYGQGFYFSKSPETAYLYGDYVYEVEITYSTDLWTSKRQGREKDFQYSDKTGFWVIPHNKAKNIRILSRKKYNSMEEVSK